MKLNFQKVKIGGEPVAYSKIYFVQFILLSYHYVRLYVAAVRGGGWVFRGDS